MTTHQELREAFVAGVQWRGALWLGGSSTDEAARRYPAPKVERPRLVLLQPKNWSVPHLFRIHNQIAQWQEPTGTWYDYLTRANVAALLDLFDHPTEWVEEEDR